MPRRANYDSFESDTDAENEANRNAGWMKNPVWIIFYIGAVLGFTFLVYILTDENKPLAATITVVSDGLITWVSLHYRTGTELGGVEDTLIEYDGLTFWQQLDGGYAFTFNKKILTLLPLALFFATLYVLLGEFPDQEQKKDFQKWLAPNVVVTLLCTIPKVFGKSGKAD